MSRVPKNTQIRKKHKIRAYEGTSKSSASALKNAPASYNTHVMTTEGKRIPRKEYYVEA